MQYTKIDIIENLTSDITTVLKDNILFTALLGSYRNGEEVYGYSDFDVLFILKSNKFGKIKNEVLIDLFNLSKRLSKKYDVKISFLTHTKFDLIEYVDIEYLTHYSWGEVFIGSQNVFDSMFYKIIKSKQISQKKLKDLMYYNIIHARFNIIRKYVSINNFNEKYSEFTVASILIDKIIEIVDWFFIYDNIYLKSKKDIVDEFKKIRTGFDLTILDDILILRSKMGSGPDVKNLKIFNIRAIDFINNITEMVIKKYKKDD